MKKSLKKNYIFSLLALSTVIVFTAFKPTADINLKTKVSIYAEDNSKREIEFSSDCKDCGPIFIYMEGKYAGQIDTKFRDRTILVKNPGSYSWK
ncbi:MAG: hypothetical protein HYZ42_08775, partial [Bacteroidetes bacterium]|nr:hypothetical protein [Bacteroidota bacterium]